MIDPSTAKENGDLGAYAHMYDVKRMGDQVRDEIPDTSGFATTQQLEQVKDDIPDVSGFATTQQLEELEAKIPAPAEEVVCSASFQGGGNVITFTDSRPVYWDASIGQAIFDINGIVFSASTSTCVYLTSVVGLGSNPFEPGATYAATITSTFLGESGQKLDTNPYMEVVATDSDKLDFGLSGSQILDAGENYAFSINIQVYKKL